MIHFLNFNKITVNFLIAGVQKAGTTSLDHYLRGHPEIGMAAKKELHFFDDEVLFSKPRINYRRLERQFNHNKKSRVYGETTPIYLFWEPCMQRIRDYNSDMKIIAILRNPAKRAFSGWNMERNRGMEKEEFLYAVRQEKKRTGHPFSEENRTFSYASRSMYANQIKRARDHFPEEQLKFIKYEEFVADPGTILKQVFRFLEVDEQVYEFNPVRLNKAAYARSMTHEEKIYLHDLFINDILEVEKLLGWNCDDWKI